VELKEIDLEGEKVSKQVDDLARLIRMKRDNLHLNNHYCPKSRRYETLRSEGDARVCFFDVENVSPPVG